MDGREGVGVNASLTWCQKGPCSQPCLPAGDQTGVCLAVAIATRSRLRGKRADPGAGRADSLPPSHALNVLSMEESGQSLQEWFITCLSLNPGAP